MQHAVHNCATIRVSEKRDVSGRVTADSREKQTMKPIVRTWLALFAASVGLYLVLPDRGLAQSITLGTLKGTYVTASWVGYFSDSSDPTGKTLIPITSAGEETFDGNGHAIGVVTVAVGAPAQVFKVPFKATYSVNADGVSLSETTVGTDMEHFDLYPTPDGSTIAQIETDAGTLRSNVLTRSSGKALLNP